MTSWNLKDVLELCTRAGSIAMGHFDFPSTNFKDDDSVVTQADREIEHFLGTYFDRPEEGSYMVGEETLDGRDGSYLSRALAATAWVVDPIDGTILYANHLHDWGISIGFMQGGALREGAVFFPVSGELFISESSRVYAGKMSPAGTRASAEAALAGLRPLARRRSGFTKSGIIAVGEEVTRVRPVPFRNPIIAGGCAVYPLMALLQGRLAAYWGPLKLWDFAGSLPLLLAIGAIVSLEDGSTVTASVDERVYFLDPHSPSRFLTRRNLLIALDEETHSRLREVLDAVGERA